MSKIPRRVYRPRVYHSRYGLGHIVGPARVEACWLVHFDQHSEETCKVIRKDTLSPPPPTKRETKPKEVGQCLRKS